MAKLFNRTRNLVIATQVECADRFHTRLVGLLGRTTMKTDVTLWLAPGLISPVNSIHTWFMKFPIDVVFVDQKLQVKDVRENLSPWKFLWPVPGARSVFEFFGGTLNQRVQIGDQLYVGD